MEIVRLGWAGLELQAAGETAVIDLFQHPGRLVDFVGEPHTPLPGPSRPGTAVLALVTHLHEDHADPQAIAAALGPDGVLVRPAAAQGSALEVAGVAPTEEGLLRLGVPQRVVAPWETVEAGPFRATAVPAVDGLGDPQVSWVVEAGGLRILHAGDTLFHGSWWSIRERVGPIDIAFLPVNGPVVRLPHRRPASPLVAAMGPREAATAAHLLQAATAVPIHYDALHRAPAYVQATMPAQAFLREAAGAGVPARIVEPGAVV
ncbi:MBL fold metallo-hydrolase [Baekduia soli]|uniref:MBL fold metallo-hydrolase n=1 Tax=Baekduia soli TaxID=496014 RepID=A0A5B8U261_9ACTN|nr:MBL fold metallo-hydrolase [Baekduia soli]QEC46935.1 MBL fold metallo-hydrolase [Baekduia soli]